MEKQVNDIKNPDRRESRANAMRHGLTSRKLLPKALRGERVEEFRQRLRRELKPASMVETVLVDEMARHAAMMEFGEQAESAVLRHGASELASLIAGNESDEEGDDDAVLSAAIATDTLDRFCRYRRMHERGFFAALQKFEEARRLHDSGCDDADRVAQFGTESQCAEWLKHRLVQPGWCCSYCGTNRGTWLEGRQRWQCSGCKRQHGIRSGTIMASSRLPLVKWFFAIQTVLRTPTLGPIELARRIGLGRQKTARSMITRIREAATSKNASELLAGLDSCWVSNRELS